MSFVNLSCFDLYFLSLLPCLPMPVKYKTFHKKSLLSQSQLPRPRWIRSGGQSRGNGTGGRWRTPRWALPTTSHRKCSCKPATGPRQTGGAWASSCKSLYHTCHIHIVNVKVCEDVCMYVFHFHLKVQI